MCAQIGWLMSFRYAVHISKCPFRHVYIFLLIFCFFKPVLNSLHDGTQTSLAAAEDNSEGIRRIVIAGTIITLVVVIFGGLVFVWMRIGCRARDRLSAGVMSLFSEAGIRPNNPTPPFNL